MSGHAVIGARPDHDLHVLILSLRALSSSLTASEARLGLPFSNIGVAQIGEDVGGSAGDPGHGLPLFS